MNTLQKILAVFDRNNKKILINASGSVAGSRKEKIRSGQAYLYKKYGMESEVVEIRFRNRVSGSELNVAIAKALKRFPYLNTRLVELDGDFYIVRNDMGIIAKRTQKLAHLGHISCGYHLVDVTYYRNTVYVAFHHALCDGKGIKPFLETLIYYYCENHYGSKASAKDIRLADSPLLDGETTEPNADSYSFDESKPPVEVSRDAYGIPENVVEEHDTDYRYEVLIPADDFMTVCKANGATPVVMTSLLVSGGIAKLYPDFDKSINANIAVDIREALDLPNTFKNCVRSMPLPYGTDFPDLSLAEQAKRQRAILNAQRDRDNCRRQANASLAMFDRLDQLPSFEEKQKMMGFFDGMLINTYVISYLGQIVLNENAQYVETMGFYNSGAAGLGVTMLCCGDKFCLNFKQSFESDKYVREFLKGLEALDIPYSASGVIPFTTPYDHVIRREENRD